MKKVLVGALILAMQGCGSMMKPAAPMANAFNEAEIAWAQAPGKNTLRASALLRQNGGGVVTCAGTEMKLIPVSNYSGERFFRMFGNTTRGFYKPLAIDFNPRVPEPDPGYVRTQISRVCDPQGFATFAGVADGEYFLSAQVVWSNGNTYSYEGGLLMQRVYLGDGETKEIVLTN